LTQFLFANDASTTLAAPINSTATAASLASGTGDEFPDPSSGQQFSGTFNDAATGLLTEIVYVTGISGDNITAMVRAQEGTVAQNWLAGDLFANLLTAGQMAAMVQSAVLNPVREVTASGAFTMTTADAGGAVGLNRVSAPAASSTTLPSAAVAGQLYAIEDLANNFNQYPVTVNAPAGMTIGTAAEVLLNNDGQCAYFRYYGSNIWSFKT
jgi:hypothetical protein